MTPEQHVNWIHELAIDQLGLEPRAGKLEELHLPGTNFGIATSYVLGTVRVHFMSGRDLVGNPLEFRVGDCRIDELLKALHNWFNPEVLWGMTQDE